MKAWTAELGIGTSSLLYLTLQSPAFVSRPTYERWAIAWYGSWLGLLIEVLLIVLPLLHFLVTQLLQVGQLWVRLSRSGLKLDVSGRVLTSLGAALFAFGYLYQLRGRVLLSGVRPEDLFEDQVALLSSTAWGVPWIALAHLVGNACSVYFLTCRLASAIKARVERNTAVIWVKVVGGLSFAVAVNVIVFFASGSAPLWLSLNTTGSGDLVLASR